MENKKNKIAFLHCMMKEGASNPSRLLKSPTADTTPTTTTKFTRNHIKLSTLYTSILLFVVTNPQNSNQDHESQNSTIPLYATRGARVTPDTARSVMD